MIALKSKQKFLSFLLENFLEKEDELTWFIQYLLKEDTLLENSHFIEEINEVPKGLFFNFSSLEKKVILLKDAHFYLDLHQIFHEVRLHEKDDLYIEVKFANRWENAFYLAILEDNPYFPWNNQVKKQVEEEVEDAFLKEELTILKEKLDATLRLGDKKEFENLVKIYKELKKESLSKDT